MAEPLISYAQNGEDILLHRALKDVHRGFYVDIGAHDPVNNSVTKHFYDHGWRGINVEPGLIFETLAAQRPGDISLNLAASDHDGEVVFYESASNTGLSSIEPTPIDAARLAPAFDGPDRTWIEAAKRERTGRTVHTTTLAAILEEHAANRTIDFLKVDVEGHEAAVLRGNDWQRFRPRILVIEAVRPLSTEPAWHEWEGILLDAAYRFAFFDGLNRYYVREESAELLAEFSAPANVLDGFTPWPLAWAGHHVAWVEGERAAAEAARAAADAARADAEARATRALAMLHATEAQLRGVTEGTGTYGLPAALMLAKTVHRLWTFAQRCRSAASAFVAERRESRLEAAAPLAPTPATVDIAPPPPANDPPEQLDGELVAAAVAAAVRKGRLGRYVSDPPGTRRQ